MLDKWVYSKRNTSHFYYKKDFIPILYPNIPVFQFSSLQNFVWQLELYHNS